jgi:hypothetical protein
MAEDRGAFKTNRADLRRESVFVKFQQAVAGKPRKNEIRNLYDPDPAYAPNF